MRGKCNIVLGFHVVKMTKTMIHMTYNIILYFYLG